MKLSDYMTLAKRDDAQMAELLDVERTTVMRLRTGRTRPSWSVADRLLKLTDGAVTPNDFVQSKDSPAPAQPASAA